MAKDKIVQCHHQLSRREFEQTSGDTEEQESLVRRSLWSHRVEYDLVTEQQQD